MRIVGLHIYPLIFDVALKKWKYYYASLFHYWAKPLFMSSTLVYCVLLYTSEACYSPARLAISILFFWFLLEVGLKTNKLKTVLMVNSVQ